MLKLNENEKKALATAQATAEADRKAELAASPLTENQKLYLVTKSFSEEFLGTLTRGDFDNRVKCINDAKSSVLSAAKTLGLIYDEKLDALRTNSATFFFGKIPEEFAPGKTVGDIPAAYPEAEALGDAIAEYLATYWVKPATFARSVAAGYTIEIPQGMSVAIAMERARFFLTVTQYKKTRNALQEEMYFLRQLLNAKSARARRDLYLEGLLDDVEDTSRSADAERKAEFFANLDEDDLVLWYLSRTLDKAIRQVDPYMSVEYDYTQFYKLEEIVGYVKAYKGSVYQNSLGQEKKLGDFNLLYRFYPYVENGLIDQDVVKYIVGCNDWVLNKFLEVYNTTK